MFLFCSRWSFVDVPLIFSCPADHVPDWQPRILLCMVEARSVNNVKKKTTTTCLCGCLGGCCLLFYFFVCFMHNLFEGRSPTVLTPTAPMDTNIPIINRSLDVIANSFRHGCCLFCFDLIFFFFFFFFHLFFFVIYARHSEADASRHSNPTVTKPSGCPDAGHTQFCTYGLAQIISFHIYIFCVVHSSNGTDGCAIRPVVSTLPMENQHPNNLSIAPTSSLISFAMFVVSSLLCFLCDLRASEHSSNPKITRSTGYPDTRCRSFCMIHYIGLDNAGCIFYFFVICTTGGSGAVRPLVRR